ncbi:lipoprotein NlpI [Thalassotalea fusca]
MSIKSAFTLSVCAVGLVLSGCMSTQNISQGVGELVIAEPVPVNYKSEIALAKLTEVLMRAEVTDSQRAQLFYDRGVVYDSVGLRSLARLDFNRALSLEPTLVDAYNFIGIHYTQLQEYNQAYDAFDSALELQPNHNYAYLNRGIALYYGGRPSLAVDDLSTFYQLNPSDPYRLLWLYIADREISPELAVSRLKSNSHHIDDSVWAKNIISLFSGDISQREFIRRLTLQVRSNKELSERLCEAYFYLGKYSEFSGRINDASNFYKLALGTNVYEFVEHRYAKLELDLIKQAMVEVNN